ncbi:glycosyltransferase [bacterium]|nr:glycosyltransferase [bacterium]
MLFEFTKYITLSLYALCLLFLLVYSISQLQLVYYYKKRSHSKNTTATEPYFPYVTIQLPVYNEIRVVERLITSCTKIHYPHNKLEIQILDDSTDETSSIITSLLKTLETQIAIHHIKRTKREGFKAGALKYGLEQAKGEFIAVFDADFIPNPDFLTESLPHFKNERTGAVQTRWEHLNRDFSALTTAQAFGLDAHFSIEQTGRNKGGFFISFNGTAGIWRKSCIIESGNWQSDTLTEDLDLSFRAQLLGWQMVYIESCASPAELPVTLWAYKSQQYRWNKGAAETQLKLLGKLLKSDLNPAIKFHAGLQLCKGLVFISSFLVSILSLPLLYYLVNNQIETHWQYAFTVSLFSVMVLLLFYSVSFRKTVGSAYNIFSFIQKFVSFLALSFGTSLHNSLAVLDGYAGVKTPFVRTPKFNIDKTTDLQIFAGTKHITIVSIAEGLLSLGFALSTLAGLYYGQLSLVLFHAMLSIGFGFIFIRTIINR